MVARSGRATTSLDYKLGPKTAHNALTRSQQHYGEDEAELAIRLSNYIRLFRHVLRKTDVVKCYISGLKPWVGVKLAQHFQLIPISE